MIPIETPYKVIKYLENLYHKKVLPKNYENENLIIYLEQRKYIIDSERSKTKFIKTKNFDEFYFEEIFYAFQKYDSFIKHHQIEYLENHYSIGDLDNLILIDDEKPNNLTLQEILAKYFKSSKHTQTNSNLANAIKIILKIDEFAEDIKDQQFVSILYPKNETRFIIICENKNRLRAQRHNFIEFWYAGGRNTLQLQFIPQPKQPIFYLFDWDFEGLNIYIHIKQNYFPTLKAVIPSDFNSLMEKQEEVKHHHSKWENDSILQYLNDREKLIATTLIKTDSIIEEQKILLTEENLHHNAINIKS